MMIRVLRGLAGLAILAVGLFVMNGLIGLKETPAVKPRAAAEARASLGDAWDRLQTAKRIHAMATKLADNATMAADIGANHYRDGILNAVDFRALDVAAMQAKSGELAARQEWLPPIGKCFASWGTCAVD